MPPKLHAGPNPTSATVEEVDDETHDHKSVHHHHDHEHHHHHSHYERTVDEDGTVREKTVTEEIITEPPSSAALAASTVGSGKKKLKQRSETVVEETNKVVEETIIAHPAPAESTALPVVDPPAAPTIVAKSSAPAPTLPSGSRHGSPILGTRTVTTTTKVISPAPPTLAPVARASSIRAASVRAPSIKPASVRPPSIAAPTTALAPVPTILEPPLLPTTAPAPPSPTPSHHSHRSHYHPEVIVNVNVPAAVPSVPPALVAAEPAPVALAPAAPIIAPVPIQATAVASVPGSPTASLRTMRLPRLFQSDPKVPDPVYVQAIPDEPAVIETQLGDEVVTKVVTTTTTTRRAATPPKTPSPVPRMAQLAYPPPPPGMTYVVNDPAYIPPKAPSLASIRNEPPLTHAPPQAPPTPTPPAAPLPGEGSPGRFVETTTVETVTYPISVDTGATTIGGPTTLGVGGTRTAVLTDSSVRPQGTKAGLRPIPLVDYNALIRATPPAKKLALTAMPTSTAPPTQAPQTILSMSADLERDSKGNEHLHATVRDHTNVKKTPVGRARTVAASPPNKPLDGKTIAPEDAISGVAERRDKRREHQDRRGHDKAFEKEIEQEIEDEVESLVENIMERAKRKEHKHKDKPKEPVYRPVGGTGLPPPKSERYAYPPAPTAIEQSARDRYMKRMGFGEAGPPGTGGMFQGMPGSSRMYGGGPPYPPPAPMTMPRPPPLMGQRPGMFGPPLMNPMMMQPGMMGGLGLMGAAMPRMGIPYAPMPGMRMGGMSGYGGFGGGSAGGWR